MAPDETDNKLTAWWLGLAPSRQEELLGGPQTAPAWLQASLDEASLDEADVDAFLARVREPTQDAGINPKPESSSSDH